MPREVADKSEERPLARDWSTSIVLGRLQQRGRNIFPAIAHICCLFIVHTRCLGGFVAADKILEAGTSLAYIRSFAQNLLNATRASQPCDKRNHEPRRDADLKSLHALTLNKDRGSTWNIGAIRGFFCKRATNEHHRGADSDLWRRFDLGEQGH